MKLIKPLMTFLTAETPRESSFSSSSDMQGFRTLEISNPKYETDHLRFITVKTSNLKGRGDICVYAPKGVTGTLPIVILLHGVYNSAWSWPYSSGVHQQVDRLIKDGKQPPMILAMPSDGLWGDGSAYLPHNSYDFVFWFFVVVVFVVLWLFVGVFLFLFL